jgi:hypothetical protein
MNKGAKVISYMLLVKNNVVSLVLEEFVIAGKISIKEGTNSLLTRKVHSTPITQQAEQSWLHTRRERKTCQSIFPEN